MNTTDAMKKEEAVILPLSIVHSILLTDPSDFKNLTVSGKLRTSKNNNSNTEEECTFEEFVHSLGFIPIRLPPEERDTTASETVPTDTVTAPSPHPTTTTTTTAYSSGSTVSSATVKNLDNPISLEKHISNTFKKAFFDSIEIKIHEEQSFTSLAHLIVELFGRIRSLVPNRLDLHAFLEDDAVFHVSQQSPRSLEWSSLQEILKQIDKAGEALAYLESSERSPTTQDCITWIHLVQQILLLGESASSIRKDTDLIQGTTRDDQTQKEWYWKKKIWNPTIHLPVQISEPRQRILSHLNCISFAIVAVGYLLEKADLCQLDIDNFHFAHFIAPKVYYTSYGVDMERKALRHEFQMNADIAQSDDESHKNSHQDESSSMKRIPSHSLPATKNWIQQAIVLACQSEVESWNDDGPLEFLRTSKEARELMLIQFGWIEGILFNTHGDVMEGNNGDPFILVPEVLRLDVNIIRQVRDVARAAVLGSALTLHAANSLSQSRPEPTDACSNFNQVIMPHVNAFISSYRFTSVTESEDRREPLIDSIAKIVREVDPNFDSNMELSLRNRSKAVLDGTDLVMNLLNERVSRIFVSMMFWSRRTHEKIPIALRAGHSIASGSVPSITDLSALVHPKSYSSLFLQEAYHEFGRGGFLVYAKELAEACLLAFRVIDVAFAIHGDILDPLIVEIIEKMQRSPL